MGAFLTILLTTFIGHLINFVAGLVALFVGTRFWDDMWFGILGGAVAGAMVNELMGMAFQTFYAFKPLSFALALIAFSIWGRLGIGLRRLVRHRWRAE